MNLKGSLFAFTVGLIQILAGASLAAAQQSTFGQLVDRFRNGQIFKAEFTHEYVDSYTKDTVLTEGTIWVGDEEYKVRNNQKIVVVDGETSRVYDANRNRVIISTYEPAEDDFAPSRFLNGADSTYVVEELIDSGDETRIILNSSDPFAIFETVEITLDRNGMPVRIFARDQADNLITTTFQGGSFEPSQQGVFVLNYPKEAEIIDMRN